ncbi:MAG: hypothetical protein FWE67_13225 [Planctomycetaceae bacterium]|nr:hypothetical protein [Planctomycetaceae bacterium]
MVLLVVGGLAGWRIASESKKLNNAARESIGEKLAEQALAITNISIKWKDKPAASDVLKSLWSKSKELRFASGEFTAVAKTPEKLYQSVSNENGLRELKITNLRDGEFNAAKEKFDGLPAKYQTEELRSAVPKDAAQFRFYKVLVPEGEKFTVTGSIELSKDGNADWQKDYLPVNPPPFGDDFVPESKLSNDVGKLEDPKTKQAILAIIRDREDFIKRFDKAWEIYYIENAEAFFNSAIEENIKNLVAGKPYLTITDKFEEKKKPDTAPIKFTVKTQTTEKLYKSAPIDKKTVLEKLELPADVIRQKVDKWKIADTFKKVIAEGILKQVEFYELVRQSGEEVVLTGTLEMTKSDDESWKLKPNSGRIGDIPEDSLLRDSQLPDNAYKLDEPETKKAVKTLITNLVDFLEKLIKQKDDFDKFCSPKMTYDGKFNAFGGQCDVTVEFEEGDDPNNVKGVVRFRPTKGPVRRSFSGKFNTLEVSQTFTGEISNATLPNLDAYIQLVNPINKMQRDATENVWNIMNENTIINIQFTSKMEFSIHRHPRIAAGKAPPEIKLELNAAVGNKPPAVSDDRSWVEPAMKKWAMNNQLMAIPRPAASTSAATPLRGADIDVGMRPDTPIGGAVDLKAEFQRCGFKDGWYENNLRNFVTYGTSLLKDGLSRANVNRSQVNKFDDAAIARAEADISQAKAAITKELAAIAAKTFFCDYTYSVGNSENFGGGNSGFTMSIDTSMKHAATGNITFPMQDVKVTGSNSDWRGFNISIRGNTPSIGELVNNKDRYRTRVWFKNLRSDNNSITADVEKIEIIRAGGVAGTGNNPNMSRPAAVPPGQGSPRPGTDSWRPGQDSQRNQNQRRELPRSTPSR